MLNFGKTTKIYIIGAVIGLLVGALIYVIQPLRLEVKAFIDISQIDNVPIEKIDITLERLNSKSFLDAATTRVNNSRAKYLLDSEECNCLKIDVFKGTNSLGISLVDSNPEPAKLAIEAVIEELHDKQLSIANKYRNTIEQKVFESELIIKESSIIIDGLLNDIKAHKVSSNNTSLASLAMIASMQNNLSSLAMIASMQNNLFVRREMLIDYKNKISKWNIIDVQLIQPVSVKHKYVFNKLWRACLFGSLLGVLLSVIWVRWGK